MATSNTITLTPEQAAVLERLVTGNRFESDRAAVGAGLDLLARQEGLPTAEDDEVYEAILTSHGWNREAAKDWLRAEIRKGMDDAAVSQLRDGPTAMRELRERYERLAVEHSTADEPLQAPR